MAELVIELDAAVFERLCARADAAGRSPEDEALAVLAATLATQTPRISDPGRSIHARFAKIGGVDLPDPVRRDR